MKIKISEDGIDFGNVAMPWPAIAGRVLQACFLVLICAGVFNALTKQNLPVEGRVCVVAGAFALAVIIVLFDKIID